MKPTTTIFLDTRREKITGKYPVKVRVTYRRKQNYYPTDIDLNKEEFVQILQLKVPKGLKEARDIIKSMESKAIDTIDELKYFNWNTFEAKLNKPKADVRNVYSAYAEYISNLEKKGSMGTASIYRCSCHSLKSFKGNLYFDDVTPDFLLKYEKWFLESGNAKATLGIYLRALRTIVNVAIADGIFIRDNYPFNRRRYQIPTGLNIKKALTLNDIKKIMDYQPQNDKEERAKDFWLFSYFGNGLNVKDIARLKNKDIQGDFIKFERAKTMGSTRQNPRIISISLLDELKDIIKRYRQTDKSPNAFVFPVLKENLTPLEERETIQRFTKAINKYMKIIADKLNLDVPCTTYYARHSFATILKRSGASVEYISEALGHSEIGTTKNYLDSFEDNTIKEFAKKLIPA